MTDQPPAGFKRPFRYDGRNFIWDANSNMAADFGGGETFKDHQFRPRGWGYIQYLPEKLGTGERSGPEADALMDEWEAWLMAKADGSNDPEIIIERLNHE